MYHPLTSLLGVLLLLPSVLLAETAGVPPDRLARVRQNGILRVCIWPDYYSITCRNPKTQQLSGIDIDLAHELAKDLGADIRAEFIDSSFARLIDDVSADRCDIAMFAIGITPARAERLRFTAPHLRSDIYAITTRGNRRIREWADIFRRALPCLCVVLLQPILPGC